MSPAMTVSPLISHQPPPRPADVRKWQPDDGQHVAAPICLFSAPKSTFNRCGVVQPTTCATNTDYERRNADNFDCNYSPRIGLQAAQPPVYTITPVNELCVHNNQERTHKQL